MKRKAIFIMEIDDFDKDAKEEDIKKEFKIEQEQYNFLRLTSSSRIKLIGVLE